MIKSLVKSALGRVGLKLERIAPKNAEYLFDEEGLRTDHNHDFIREPRFLKAYQAGAATGDMYPGRWRFHVGLWAAQHAAKLAGDFVECGVNTGSLSVACLNYVDWNSLGKSLHLFDTWEGFDRNLVSAREAELGAFQTFDPHYKPESYERAKSNFARFPRVNFYRGSVPSTLSMATIEQISYLSIDMNCMAPEIAAAEYFWDKIVSGGMILLDDYGWNGPHIVQKEAFDKFAADRDTQVLSLPTGQGLIVKR